MDRSLQTKTDVPRAQSGDLRLVIVTSVGWR